MLNVLGYHYRLKTVERAYVRACVCVHIEARGQPQLLLLNAVYLFGVLWIQDHSLSWNSPSRIFWLLEALVLSLPAHVKDNKGMPQHPICF